MVGAMPAVAVRQQRKHIRHEEHKQRPSTLTIDQTHHAQHHTGGPTPLKSPRGSPQHQSPAHSPVTSPKSPATNHKHNKQHQQLQQHPQAHLPRTTQKQPQTCVNGYLFGRISLLHVSVLFVFLGVTLLVVGLVQLAPGAHTELNKYAIIGFGTGFLGLGFAILIILCACQKRAHKRRKRHHGPTPPSRPPPQKQKKCKSRRKGTSKSKTSGSNSHVQTVDGALAAASAAKSGRGKASDVHPAQTDLPPVADFRILNEKDTTTTTTSIADQAFVKSPSESDALLQQRR